MDLLFQMRVFSNVTYLHGIRLKFRNILFNSLTKMELEVKFGLRPKKKLSLYYRSFLAFFIAVAV